MSMEPQMKHSPTNGQPLVFVIDTSESMSEDGKIGLLNELLYRFKNEMQSNELVRERVEVAIISFGHDVKLMSQFVGISDFTPPTLIAQGGCPMGEAILQAIEIVDQQKNRYKENSLEYYRPICILIAGSEPTDMHIGDAKWQKVMKRIHTGEVTGDKFQFFTLSVEPANIELLKSIAPPNRPPFGVNKNTVNMVRFLELFRWGIGSDVWGYAIKRRPPQQMVQLEDTLGWDLLKEPEVQPNLQKAKQIKQKSTTLPLPHFFGTSVIGPLHIQRGIPCQDACAYEILSSGFGVIAVADGLGSAPRSDIGAKSVVDAAIKTGKAAIAAKKKDEINYGEILREIVFSARKTLEARAIEEKCSLRELACTIIVVLTYEDTIAVAHVGDGAVVAKTNDGFKLISEPEESEYVNEVVPLTSMEWEKSLRISAKVSEVECVAVFTDGCQRAALLRTQNGLQPYDRFFEPLFTYAQELDNLIYGEQDIRDLLASQKMSENSEDDKTLVISVLRERYEVND